MKWRNSFWKLNILDKTSVKNEKKVVFTEE
jgi:hypothetical protein